MIQTVLAPQAVPARPRHLAIIMDGNRRWARERELPAIAGHRAGATALRKIVRASARAGIEFLTVYAFSEENWKRESGEIHRLMELLRLFALRERASLRRENVRVCTIGRVELLPPATREALSKLCEATSGNDGLVLSLALNYGSRSELCDAVRSIARDVVAGKLEPASVDDGVLARYLYTAGLPDPDLLIRTGGELRVSNFLLYQIAYTELWSTPVNWPDFDQSLFDAALRSYAARQRRFGT